MATKPQKTAYGSQAWIASHPVQAQYPYATEVCSLAWQIWGSQQSQKLYQLHLTLYADEKFQSTVLQRATPEDIARTQQFLDMAIEHEKAAHQIASERGLTDIVAAYIAEGME